MDSELSKARFWRKVDIRSDDECWEWRGSTDNGYPSGTSVNCIKTTPAQHVLGLSGHKKKSPTSVARHTCGNSLCLNPKHLFWGNAGVIHVEDSISHFWERIKIGDEHECWEWQGAKIKNGYGKMIIGNIQIYAHRFAYELTNGKLGVGLIVRHTCDNRACCNPKHLIGGTKKQNTDDARSRGRMAYQRMIPVKKYRLPHVVKLAKKDVREILMEKEKGTSQRTIAKIWDVSESMISRIVNRNRHLDITISA